MLGIVFALEKWHQYTFGRPVTLYSGHKPLESIAKKPLDRAPKRLQGILMLALAYNVEVRYRRGRESQERNPQRISRNWSMPTSREGTRLLARHEQGIESMVAHRRDMPREWTYSVRRNTCLMKSWKEHGRRSEQTSSLITTKNILSPSVRSPTSGSWTDSLTPSHRLWSKSWSPIWHVMVSPSN